MLTVTRMHPCPEITILIVAQPFAVIMLRYFPAGKKILDFFRTVFAMEEVMQAGEFKK